MIVDENFLIADEHDAISGYNTYLKQGVRNKKIIPIIKSIIRDEERHIRLLNKIKKMKGGRR
jgi:rubrerythrin